MDKRTVFNRLVTFLNPNQIKTDEPLKNYTYTQMGGQADFLVFPTSFRETEQTVQCAHESDMPITILGNGSNVIIKDGGIRGIVVNLTRLNQVTRTGNKIVAQSGAAIIEVSRFALENHLTGLEFACGIPGTVGGAVFMNAGAYGGEMVDVLESALLLDNNGACFRLPKKELALEYRNSVVAKKGYLVLEATFCLTDGIHEEIRSKMKHLTDLRTSKQPLEFPSCGSVFKRPPGYFAGKLIQDSELQGVQIGGAQVSTKHAGFIVNVNHASATDYIKLIHHVQDIVGLKFNVRLETEVKIIGEDEQPR
jgi:UDP-N-acetylmuramate dehydrogenase